VSTESDADPSAGDGPREDRRGKGADWRNPWPVVGVRQADPEPSAGVDALRAEGYRSVFDVEPIETDRDTYQEHLNNTAAIRMFNELRIAYVAKNMAPRWPKHIRKEGLTVAVRELRALYESEGWMHERYVGGVRIAHRRGKAGLIEQRLVEATTARPLARAWIVQLLVASEGVVHWPDWYWDMVAAIDGPATELDGTHAPWGPPG
jgi:acyl-CoA thioesterase FadM